MSLTHPDDPLLLDATRPAGETRAPEFVSPFKLFDVIWRRRVTLLLVMAGAVPPRLQAISTNSPFPPVAGVAASGAQPMSPTSDR